MSGVRHMSGVWVWMAGHTWVAMEEREGLVAVSRVVASWTTKQTRVLLRHCPKGILVNLD